jgi:hypothetical protein
MTVISRWTQTMNRVLTRHTGGREPDPAVSAGGYESLYMYLRDRYANRLVLTFREIEDLLGFPLPDAARIERDWWTVSTDRSPSPQSYSWTLAGRDVEVNLEAGTVVFERPLAVR